MPKHAVGRGAQAKLRRGSKRAFFTCVGEAGSAGSNLEKERSVYRSHCPPPWGLWSFWGSSLLVAPPKKSRDTVPQKLPALKCFKIDKKSGRLHRSAEMIPAYSLRQPRSPCSPIPAPSVLFRDGLRVALRRRWRLSLRDRGLTSA